MTQAGVAARDLNRGCTPIPKTVIRCTCGHRVIRRDVIQTGLYLSVLGPSYVYVRFRCGRCKRIGEQLVQEDNWDASVLREPRRRVARAEMERFRQLGEITPDEVIEFHYALERLSAEPDAAD